MKPRTFRLIGEALYGVLWQARVSHAIGVSDRTIRRWAHGDVAIPSRLRTELVALAERRRREIDEALRMLRTEE